MVLFDLCDVDIYRIYFFFFFTFQHCKIQIKLLSKNWVLIYGKIQFFNLHVLDTEQEEKDIQALVKLTFLLWGGRQ